MERPRQRKDSHPLLSSFLDLLSLTKGVPAVRVLATRTFQYDLGDYHVTCTDPSRSNSSRVTRTLKPAKVQGGKNQNPTAAARDVVLTLGPMNTGYSSLESSVTEGSEQTF